MPVLVERQRVDHEGIPEEVHMLAGVAHAVCPGKYSVSSRPRLMDSESDRRTGIGGEFLSCE